MSEEEHEVEVEVEESPTEEKVELAQEDELQDYTKGVKKRIGELTKKYRQEENEKKAALRQAQELQAENAALKSRMQNLDQGFLNERGQSLKTRSEAAKKALKEAHEMGDYEAVANAQEQISALAVEQQQYNAAKLKSERMRKQPAQQQQQQQKQPVQRQQPPKPDPKAEAWAQKNEWFGEDRVMTAVAFAVHSELTEVEGFDAGSDEYYTALDNRIREEFPHRFSGSKKSGGGQVASASSSASRSTKQGRTSVRLTPRELATAKSLGIKPEDYAREKLKIEQRS